MNPEPIYVPVKELMAATGLGPRQLRADITAGLLPGMIVRRQVRVLRSQWNAYVAGEWQPRKPIEIVSINSRKSKVA